MEKIGLFGVIGSGGTIRNLGVIGATSGTAAAGNFSDNAPCFVGILAGYSAGTIDKCYATGNVSSSYPGRTGIVNAIAGGLAGYNAGVISNSYATGNVSAFSNVAYAGGLVGYANEANTISNSYATGNVSSSYSAYSYMSSAGGLAGYSAGAISNSYATGNVSASSIPSVTFNILGGGLVGQNNSGRYANCYRNSNAEIRKNNNAAAPIDASIAGIVAKTKAEMQADAFVALLNSGTSAWERRAGKNDDLPYIKGVGVGK